MTTNTPAPAQQAVLTDDGITNVLRRLAVRPGDHDFNLGQCIAGAIESALLSKLRAPVADERAAALAALASVWRINAAEAFDYGKHKEAATLEACADELAALASAPVAGEAQTYLPSRIAVREACDLLDKIKKSHGHWGGWSSIPSVCDEAIGLLRCSGTNAAPQAREAVRDEDHPVFAFLLGEGPLRGVHFGDRHPDERGAYWWRKDLSAALSAQPGAQKNGGGDA